MLKKLFPLICLLLISQFSFSQNTKEETVKKYENEFKYKKIIRQALSYHSQKNFTKALEKFEEAFQIIDNERIDLYNAACSASLAQNYEKANYYLNRSIESGYIDINWMSKDTDFTGLKETPYWKEILKNINEEFNLIVEDFKGVKGVALTDLIPYKKDDKWGYIDKNTKKIIVTAKYKEVFFAGTCLKVEIIENNIINVDKDGKITIFRPERTSDFPPMPPFFGDNPKVDPSPEFKGFRVDKYGKISHVSAIFDKTEWQSLEASDIADPEIEIIGPFKIEGKWYAIVQKDNKWGIIDEEGNTFKNIKFEYEALYPVRDYIGADCWFYFQDVKSNRGFIHSSGKIKFYKEFNEYPFTTQNRMGLGILTNDKKENGIIDFTKMEWVIKPIPNDIVHIEYTYNGDCNNVPYDQRNKVIDFYFLIRDKDQKEYYMGKNKEIYVPK